MSSMICSGLSSHNSAVDVSAACSPASLPSAVALSPTASVPAFVSSAASSPSADESSVSDPCPCTAASGRFPPFSVPPQPERARTAANIPATALIYLLLNFITLLSGIFYDSFYVNRHLCRIASLNALSHLSAANIASSGTLLYHTIPR